MKSTSAAPTLAIFVALFPALAWSGDVISRRDGPWSGAQTWEGGKVPAAGDRVLVHSGHRVQYDVESDAVLRAVCVSGTLTFSREKNTRLTVGLLKVQPGDAISEEGFNCDAHAAPEGGAAKEGAAVPMPALEVGTAEKPIPAGVRAVIRLAKVDGQDAQSCPAAVSCEGRMDFHGAPLSRTWVKLGATAAKGAAQAELSEAVTGWQAGDRIILTGTHNPDEKDGVQTEERTISAMEGMRITLDRPLEYAHSGEGEYRGEVANLSRTVIVESADPAGIRGHTMYHSGSAGSISYAEFRHLGKKNVLGRYAIHFHLAGASMRGSSVVGASIWDSENRWITIHGTHYLVVRDCVGYRSVGHGYFLEDGTEVYNVLDRNLGVQAMKGRPLPKQALPFDQNQGAAFWWANSLNTFTHNVAVENDHYGYRFEATRTSSFSLEMPVRQPDGSKKTTDIRTLPFVRFEDNESHSEAGLYAFNFGEGVDGAGPDERHPFIVRRCKAWNVHYAFRPQVPSLLVEGLHIANAAYGVYHPNFDRHVYRDVLIRHTETEPFNRGHDDLSVQRGILSVDGLRFENIRSYSMPLIQITDDNGTGTAESHFRNVSVTNWTGPENQRAILNRGGGPRPAPKTDSGVPVILHDWYGKGRHARVVSSAAKDFAKDGRNYRPDPPLTGDESRVAEVSDVPWPELLHPIDDLPPATVITSVRQAGGKWTVSGMVSDASKVKRVIVNGQPAKLSGDWGAWEAQIEAPQDGMVSASSEDDAGNREITPHAVQPRRDG